MPRKLIVFHNKSRIITISIWIPPNTTDDPYPTTKSDNLSCRVSIKLINPKYLGLVSIPTGVAKAAVHEPQERGLNFGTTRDGKVIGGGIQQGHIFFKISDPVLFRGFTG
jgi:hypothetical protein